MDTLYKILHECNRTKTFYGVEYEITVSPNPEKTLVKDRETGDVFNLNELTRLECELLALISALSMLYGLYEEDTYDKS